MIRYIYLCFIFYLLQCFGQQIISVDGKDLFDACSAIEVIEEIGTFKIFKFEALLLSNDVGYSVELIFSGSVGEIQANDSRSLPAHITRYSDERWIISVPVNEKMEVRKAEFTANFANPFKRKLLAVILNGDQVLCGEGKSVVPSPMDYHMNANKECQTFDVLAFEEETIVTIREEIQSTQLGLVIDILFESDVADLLEISNMKLKTFSKRHFSMFNSGYITSKEKPVEVRFNINHPGGPTPRISAIIVNNVVVCGFAAKREVFDYKTLDPMFKLLDEGIPKLELLDNLILSSIIISACGLLVTIMSGVFAVKLASPLRRIRSESEPLYATVDKRNQIISS